jgi:hypothetical protein
MRTRQLFAPLMLLTCLAIGSCSDNCCSLHVNKICEGDEDPICSNFATWEECKTYLEGLSYNCK